MQVKDKDGNQIRVEIGLKDAHGYFVTVGDEVDVQYIRNDDDGSIIKQLLEEQEVTND